MGVFDFTRMTIMTRTTLAALLLGAVAGAASGGAAAINCYEILDRNDNVVYRGTMPPIDLSDQGKAEREALRQRGQQLIAMDVDRCIGIEYFTGAAGSSALTVDQIVGGVPALRGRSLGSAPASGGSIAGNVPAVSPTAAAPAPSGASIGGGGTRTSR